MKSFGGIGKQLKILVIGYGLEVEHALKLADDGHDVYYYTQWSSSYPKLEDYAPGLGYESRGLKKVKYIWEIMDDMDLVCFFDIGFGDLAAYLRKKGKAVFGGGVAEKLENDRKKMRALQAKMGLPMQKTEQVQGIPALREYLQANPNKYVKVDIFRGNIESFKAKTYEKIKLYIDESEDSLGPFSQTYDFMVEDFIDGIEPGFDMFFNGKDWMFPYLWGIEQSKNAYIGKFVSELPKPLKLVADKLKIVLSKLDYRGPISVETRVTKDGIPYLIDICVRFPYPLSSCYTYAIKNYSELIYAVAKGETVQIDVKDTYIGAMPLEDSHAEDHYIRLDFPKDLANKIKTRISAKVKGQIYGVKGTKVVFIVCETDNNWKNLIKKLQFTSKKCDSYGLMLDELAGLDKIAETIKEYPSHGMGEF